MGTDLAHFVVVSVGEEDRPERSVCSVVSTAVEMLPLSRRAAVAALLPSPTETIALFRQIESFIAGRLADPSLTPAVIAAAHHISTRTLHRLFRAHDSTVSGRIRALRLERCRVELLDPTYVGRSVYAIGRRWGFPDPAHFTRAFKAVFGSSPAAYRREHLPSV